jgi:hypothetical protein
MTFLEHYYLTRKFSQILVKKKKNQDEFGKVFKSFLSFGF